MLRTILSAIILSVTILAAAPAMATDTPVDLTLRPPEGMKANKTFVAFPHARHEAAELDCITCHHTWDGTSEIQKCATSGCHDQPGKKGANSFYAAFHNKRTENSCLGCHKVEKKAGRDVPISCKSCHPK